MQEKQLNLNKEYYFNLLKKYDCSFKDESKFSTLVSKMIVSHFRDKNLNFNIPKIDDYFFKIINKVFNEFAVYAFKEFPEFPNENVGSMWKRKNGRNKGVFKIINKELNKIIIEDKASARIKINSDSLIKNYIQILQNGQEKKLKSYEFFFRDSNEIGFLPTNFSKKILFVGRSVWESLENKDKIPTIYFSKNRDEDDYIEKRSIPLLNDCLVYVIQKYDSCYEQFFKKDTKIDTIVLCGADESVIHQMLQDQTLYNFKTVVINNNILPVKSNLECWKWFKEEIQLIEGL